MTTVPTNFVLVGPEFVESLMAAYGCCTLLLVSEQVVPRGQWQWTRVGVAWPPCCRSALARCCCCHCIAAESLALVASKVEAVLLLLVVVVVVVVVVLVDSPSAFFLMQELVRVSLRIVVWILPGCTKIQSLFGRKRKRKKKRSKRTFALQTHSLTSFFGRGGWRAHFHLVATPDSGDDSPLPTRQTPASTPLPCQKWWFVAKE